MESEKRNGRTKVSLALPPEHPALVLELKCITQDRKTFRTWGHFAPWTSYIPKCQDDDEEGRNRSNVGILELREFVQNHSGDDAGLRRTAGRRAALLYYCYCDSCFTASIAGYARRTQTDHRRMAKSTFHILYC